MADDDSPDDPGSVSGEVERSEIPEEAEETDKVIGEDFSGEGESYDAWQGGAGEYGEGGQFYLPAGEGEELEYLPTWKEPEAESEASESRESVASSVSEVEETDEERAIRLERERLLELLRGKLMERIGLRRRNQYLHKKLVEHFRKRRMDHVLREDLKGFELESKYLKRLFVFQEFKDNQEMEINELTESLAKFRIETDDLEESLKETLSKFLQRQKDLSMGLVSTKTGKKLNEKTVDRLLRRQEHKCAEKGKLKLKYVKLKNLIEEKEKQLKALEHFGDGLHIMDYEQLKIDNQNYNDKIEEKEEELIKLRMKTQGNIQNLAQVREKAYAIEGDIELLEAKFNKVETEFSNTRERVSEAKKKRDYLREEYARIKMQSGLLSNERLLLDFEKSIHEKGKIRDVLDEMRGLIREKNKQHRELVMKLHKKSTSPKKYYGLD